jgi:hypothetical protein
MKYLGYALFYYAVFSAFVGSTHLSGNQHARGLDVRYQLFLYFSALESCYVRLHQNDEKQPEYGLLSGFPLK